MEGENALPAGVLAPRLLVGEAVLAESSVSESKRAPLLFCTANEVGELGLWPRENITGLRTSRTFSQLLKVAELGCALQTNCSGGITEPRSLPYCTNHVLYFLHLLMF